jgi:protoporphyrinogen oxidase
MLQKAVILGGGSAGLAIADELARREVQTFVLVPEQGSPDNGGVGSDPFFDLVAQLQPGFRNRYGWLTRLRMLISQVWAKLFPCRQVRSVEDLLVNRFGRLLYRQALRPFARKVWGKPCESVLADGQEKLQVADPATVDQEELAHLIEQQGGKVMHHQTIYSIYSVPHEICSVHVRDTQTGELSLYPGDRFYSTLPIRSLIRALNAWVPEEIRTIADRLYYRSIVKVTITRSRAGIPFHKYAGKTGMVVVGDRIYILRSDVQVARVQFGEGKVLGSGSLVLEYCCTARDQFWLQDDLAIRRLAIADMVLLELTGAEDVMEIKVSRIEDSILVHSDGYNRLEALKAYTRSFQNLELDY